MKKIAAFVVWAVVLPVLLACPAGASYILRAEDGFLRAREEPGGALVYQGEIPVSALPERDRPLLSAGLLLPDRAALTRALEDFCS